MGLKQSTKNRQGRTSLAGFTYWILREGRLDGSRYAARTQATGAGVNVTGRTVNQRFDALYIGLPGAVASSVRVGYPNTEADALAANIAFCHNLHLLLVG
jgi:hypothetical protein